MKKFLFLACLLCAAPAFAASVPPVDKPAPDFTGTDTGGAVHHLSDYKGKVVVLEWTNPDCPYVHKMYDTGTMQALQQDATAKGVVWLSIVSSAPDMEGYMTPAEANAYMKKAGAAASARILDPTGTIGRLYGATSTPDMYVIDKNGVLVYEGAVDDRPTADHSAVSGADNYVQDALNALAAGKPVSMPVTQPYGCHVAYAE